MNELEEEKYYNRLGWYTPIQLSQISLEVATTDSGIATIISDLAVVRNVGSSELEMEFQEYIQAFLRKKVPGFDTIAKQSKSPWN